MTNPTSNDRTLLAKLRAMFTKFGMDATLAYYANSDSEAADDLETMRAVDLALSGDSPAQEAPKDASPQQRYLSESTSRLSKFYDAIKDKLSTAEQNELWSLIGNFSQISVDKFAHE